jgi:hypothetical protein
MHEHEHLVILSPDIEWLDDQSLNVLGDISVDLTLGRGLCLKPTKCHEEGCTIISVETNFRRQLYGSNSAENVRTYFES